ncbi:ileal sodium/bile acid cotransporter-like isoform X1 [Clavelina lepadiformis]|uniref:ileal sodium/bile acid cotransporter-like isoform X1 n=2 Tax=Clavelina lepadiformis TaxID=159417 RepID=UPI0040426BC3
MATTITVNDAVTTALTETTCSTSENGSNNATQIATQVILAVIMFGLGCSADAKLMWRYIKRPKIFITGLALQLLLMPFLGFGLARAFQLTEAETIGVIIQASAPGGAYSNIASYWLDGDMDLSIVMTTSSTILALGTMPLWLFVFPTIMNLQDECLTVSFSALGFSLLGICAPLLVGLLVKYKFPEKSVIVTKICSGLGSFAILVLVIVVAATQGSGLAESITWRQVVVVIIFPVLALVLGYFACRVPWLKISVSGRRTIAIETAMQSSAVANTIVLVSYDQDSPNFAPVFLFSGMYGIIQLVVAFVVVVSYLIAKKKGVNCVVPSDADQETNDPKAVNSPDGIVNLGYKNTEAD